MDNATVSAWLRADAAVAPSCTAIASSKGPKNGKLYTEDDWNETATLEESPYLLSKVRPCTLNKLVAVCRSCMSVHGDTAIPCPPIIMSSRCQDKDILC